MCIVVRGIGNLLLSDESVGVHVIDPLEKIIDGMAPR